MSFYDYKCKECGTVKEFEFKITENIPHFRMCEKCGNYMNRLFSSSVLEFKGTGFYKTDYKKQSTSSK